jgi:plasmid maintenance system antidote protein VapI
MKTSLPLIIPGQILLEEFLLPLGISQNQRANKFRDSNIS